eukprot:CAMPEP_0194275632 /NCGR_PEP_ID=MMETSP0169-20130528/8419_1 /TAXON_ID=218684 /ORGANISM="Corethron pennatum, Strain L29A3" /LENGTH=38 /DNA_ID= /DNA_START= /DNA_END= /DNA_ORIENTATION=
MIWHGQGGKKGVGADTTGISGGELKTSTHPERTVGARD